MKRNLCGAWLLIAVCFAVACRQTGSEAPPANQQSAPTNSPTSAPQTSAAQIPGACANPYFPVGPNVKRQYRTTFTNHQIPTSTYAETFSNFGADGFLQHQQFGESDLKIERRWRCTAEGVGSQEYADLAVSQSNFKFKTLGSGGVIYPAPSLWKQGHVWEYSFDVSGEIRTPGMSSASGGASAVAVSGKISVRNEIVARETVTVAAGTFDAWKVRSAITQNMTTSVNKISAPINNVVEIDAWFAPDAGLVKSNSAAFGAQTELIAR